MNRLVERVARELRPFSFVEWTALYTYRLKRGDTEEAARTTADSFYQHDIDAARRDAQAVTALILAEAAKVAEAEYQSCLSHPQGHGLGTASRIKVAIERLGDR